MSFEPEDDDDKLTILLNIGFVIGILIFTLFLFSIMSCASKKDAADCVFVCPNKEAMPENCYCIGDSGHEHDK